MIIDKINKNLGKFVNAEKRQGLALDKNYLKGDWSFATLKAISKEETSPNNNYNNTGASLFIEHQGANYLISIYSDNYTSKLVCYRIEQEELIETSKIVDQHTTPNEFFYKYLLETKNNKVMLLYGEDKAEKGFYCEVYNIDNGILSLESKINIMSSLFPSGISYFYFPYFLNYNKEMDLGILHFSDYDNNNNCMTFIFRIENDSVVIKSKAIFSLQGMRPFNTTYIQAFIIPSIKKGVVIHNGYNNGRNIVAQCFNLDNNGKISSSKITQSAVLDTTSQVFNAFFSDNKLVIRYFQRDKFAPKYYRQKATFTISENNALIQNEIDKKLYYLPNNYQEIPLELANFVENDKYFVNLSRYQNSSEKAMLYPLTIIDKKTLECVFYDTYSIKISKSLGNAGGIKNVDLTCDNEKIAIVLRDNDSLKVIATRVLFINDLLVTTEPLNTSNITTPCVITKKGNQGEIIEIVTPNMQD